MGKTRLEFDSLGNVEVPADRYYGAQTQRALEHFQIGTELMPLEIIMTLALIKKAAAKTNAKLSVLQKSKADLIIRACDEILAGKLDESFPLTIWQSGSATQTNMNLNEVIANRAIEFAKGKLGSKTPIHPNDDVNMGQSTNDVFPSAMHIATLFLLTDKLLPAIDFLLRTLKSKSVQFKNVKKIGRTHLQDALPMTLGQEFSGYAAQIELAVKNIKNLLPALGELALGGTAVGTGLNAHKRFGVEVVRELAKLTGLKLKSAPNKFYLLAAHDALTMTSGALKVLATSLFKIANDIRWLASGPHCGLGEIILPNNEPGSSIMPGKINPTQCEVMLMVCAQVIGNDAVVSFANSQGNFELNVFKPIIIQNILQAINLLSDASFSFAHFALSGIKANKKQLDKFVNSSLMLATALNPIIGYDKACKLVQYANTHNISLRDACIKLDYLTAQKFDSLINAQIK